MEYHDNEVFISVSSENGYTLKSGNYVIDSFYITSGEDPDNDIYKGLTNTFNSDGKMVFRVGRKLNTDVADWFKESVNASQTTFNYDPDELNFAFLGDLELKITGGVLRSKADTFIFSDIIIAQGYSGSSNNWWFGGKNCKFIDDNTVSCFGIGTNGIIIEFNFLRGGNSESTVITSPIGVSNWMSNLDDSVMLGQLIMPGSHVVA